ncbi:MAG: hypothetical protein IJC79_04205 [Clostridia bacterium]|nr:hypothetical protein [Clostridia bacterium]
MQKLTVSDITLKQSAKSTDYTLSFREKIEIAKLLNKIHVSVIELPAIVKEKTDMLLIKSVASCVHHSVVAVPVNLQEGDVERVAEALKGAAKPRIQIQVPVSTVQMEYICGKKPAAVLEMIKDLTIRAKALCTDVEFIADDATRSDIDFLYKAVESAVENGATTVTVCDTAGTMFPDEISDFISDLIKNVPSCENINIGVQCSNAIEMACAGSIAALKAGASEVKVSSVASKYTASMESICQIIRTHGDSFGFTTGVRTTEYHKAAKQIDWIVNGKHGQNSPFEHVTVDSGEDFVLSEHDDITEVSKAIAALGYDLSQEDITNVYNEFKRISTRKTVTAKELDVIIASTALQVPMTYVLESYVINSGNVISATANITVKKNGETIRALANGDGPIDAAFLAVEQVIGHRYELDDFQIQAVTEGQEAMGSALVKLRSNGKLYSGKGLSTDIIGASIRAYINAINKIVYEEV